MIKLYKKFRNIFKVMYFYKNFLFFNTLKQGAIQK